MIREELTTKILNLHEQAKKMTEYSDLLISRVQLEDQVAAMSYKTLEAAMRFYEGLLDPDNE